MQTVLSPALWMSEMLSGVHRSVCGGYMFAQGLMSLICLLEGLGVMSEVLDGVLGLFQHAPAGIFVALSLVVRLYLYACVSTALTLTSWRLAREH
jgi:hypothetical protein